MDDVILPLGGLSLEEQMLHERAIRDGEELQNSESRLLADVMEVDVSRFFFKLGLKSTHAYCCEHMRLTPPMASNYITVARKSREVPALCQAIFRGELSVSTARKLTPVVTLDNAPQWIAKARTFTKDRLERELADAAPEAHARMKERSRKVYRDRVEKVFSWPESVEAEFARARDLVSQSLGHGASIEETITQAVRVFLYYKDPVVRAERNVRRRRGRRVERVSQDTSARGAKLPASLKAAVDLEQKRRCQARDSAGKLCGATRHLHYHHRVPRSEGGRDTVENIITLCGPCHRRWHKLRDSS